MKLNLSPLAIIFYVDDINIRPGESSVAGRANGPIVRILKKYSEDAGLLHHELFHVGQFWVLFIISAIMLAVSLEIFPTISPLFVILLSAHSLGYLLFEKYRYWSEIHAYAKQLKFCDNKEERLELFASFIVNDYNIDNISQKQTIADLKKLYPL